MILQVARRHRGAVEGSPVGLELLFTRQRGERAGRRQGLRRRAAARRTCGYVFDHATPIGEIVVASPTYYRLEAEFRGQAAHAGHPPRGRAHGRSSPPPRAIAAMRARAPRRRDDGERRRRSRGGVGGTNVVARALRVRRRGALARATRRPRTVVAEMVDRLPRRRQRSRAASATSTSTSQRLFAGYRHTPATRRRSSPPRRRCAPAATRRAASSPAAARTPTPSRPPGLPCTNLANGTERNHEPTERVSAAALEGMLDVDLRPARRAAPPA